MSMGRRYGFTGALTTAASTTRAELIGATTIRPRTYMLMLAAANATPNDYVNEYTFKRISAITNTINTQRLPTALDTAEPATLVTTTSGSATGINCTAEGTYTASSELLYFSHNMHAVYAWYAPDGGEIAQAATATTGMGLFFVGGTTAYNDQMTWHFSE